MNYICIITFYIYCCAVFVFLFMGSTDKLIPNMRSFMGSVIQMITTLNFEVRYFNKFNKKPRVRPKETTANNVRYTNISSA